MTHDLPAGWQWQNEPQSSSWSIVDRKVHMEPAFRTDYWQKTHYGTQTDNAPFLYTTAVGDAVLTTHVSFSPVHQYDQAGLHVRLSANCWLKTSVEYESPDEPSRLGVVVTNHGYSDWSTQDVSSETREMWLRVRREGSDYIVEHGSGQGPIKWHQLRMCHLMEDDGSKPVLMGLYAANPSGIYGPVPQTSGFRAIFDVWELQAGRV